MSVSPVVAFPATQSLKRNILAVASGKKTRAAKAEIARVLGRR